MVKKIVISSALVFIAVLLAALVACQQQGEGSVSNGSEGSIDVEVVENVGDAVAGGGANASFGAVTDEEWPGQSLGYVGLNGEGAYTQDDWETDEEYAAIMREVYKEEYDAPSIVRDGSYIEGMLRITFDRSYGELHAREVVAESGGEWVSSDFKYHRSDSDKFIDGIATVNVYYPDALDEDSLLKVAADLEELPEVMWAELNGVLHSSDNEESILEDGGDVVAAASALQQYYLTSSGFSHAWEKVKCNGSVGVAVIDSGFCLDHTDLQANYLPGYDAANQTLLLNNYLDDDGHGTKVAGVISAIAGNAVGVDGASYNAKLLPIRVMDDSGEMTWDYLNRALQRVIAFEDSVQVVNISLESIEGDASCEALLAQLHEDGVTCVAAAGNWRDGEESDYCVKYPAAYGGVISVAAVDASNVIADFSNKNQYVDLCAPGVSIYTTANPLSATTLNLYYGTDSGTSFAAPQVAAAAALLKVQHSDWTPDQIESRLESTARDLGVAGRDNVYGYGALDAAEAVGWIDYSSYFGLGGHVMYDDTLDLQDLYCLPNSGHMPPSGRPTAAATRDAMSACLILGLDLVEESGQCVQIVRVG